MTNLQTLIAVGESQKKQTELAKSQAAALEASQKKLEATLKKLDAAEKAVESASAQTIPVKPAEPLVIPETQMIPFAFDSSVIDEASRLTILGVAEKLHNEPRLKVELLGMSDPQGDQAYNRELSLRRAGAVAAVIANAGIPAERMNVGVGAFSDDKKAIGQRRVEVIFRLC